MTSTLRNSLQSIMNNISFITTRKKTYYNSNDSKTKKSRTSSKSSKQRAATKKIQTFMKTFRHKIRARFLNHICSDSGVCITFGKEIDTIKKHFNGFVDFDYVSKIKRLGEPSENGFINEITYEHKGYRSHAILKSMMREDSDNLYYEYLVGMHYVNKLNLVYPCFLETYGCYIYKNDSAWQTMMSNRNTNLKKSLEYFPEKNPFNTSCKESQYISILIQHIDGAKGLRSMLSYRDFNNNDLVYILFQVYMALSCVADTFTHFDLHTDNILVYQPSAGKYIEYHYHDGNKEYTFKSKYIAKIIDYGRSHFKNDDKDKYTGSSKIIMDNVCRSKDCIIKNKHEIFDCGNLQGYAWMNKPADNDELKNSYYISSSIRNMSHDLRTMYILKGFFNKRENRGKLELDSLKEILDKVQYCKSLHSGDDCYGTIENTKSGLPNKINNVKDAHNALLGLVKDPNYITENNDEYNNLYKLGDLHVYYDGRPMEFIELKPSSKGSEDSSP